MDSSTRLAKAKKLETETGIKHTISCALCGMECATQIPEAHLRKAHGMTTKQYRALGHETLSEARLQQLRASPLAQGQRRQLYGADHPNFKGGCINGAGYRIICVNGRRIPEHRYVMEQALGRALEPHEHVHHKDGDKTNNDLSNLEVVTPQKHSKHLDANPRRYYRIAEETIKAAKVLHSLGWSVAAIQRALRTDHDTVLRWLELDNHA